MKKKYWITVVLLLMCLGINAFSGNKTWVEDYYSNGIYPKLSAVLRLLFGWFPFSFGDLLYGGAVLSFFIGLLRLGRRIAKRQFDGKSLASIGYYGLNIAATVYLVFNIFWGLNYNRYSAAQIFGTDTTAYTKQDLVNLSGALLQKVNESKQLQKPLANERLRKRDLFEKSYAAYTNLQKDWPFLKPDQQSLKPSIWSYVGDYAGFWGYYNPFTGEAQVNTTIPTFLQPYTSCHEVAHQIGFAKEDEANFVGYLAAAASDDPRFRYSVYFDLFMYANRNLYEVDSTLAKSYYDSLSIDVKGDIKTLKEFQRKYRNPISPIITTIYSFYLRNNAQPQGMVSYSDVVGLVIGYRKKYGRL